MPTRARKREGSGFLPVPMNTLTSTPRWSVSQGVRTTVARTIDEVERLRPHLFMDLRGHDYTTIDDMEFDKFTASGLTSVYGSCAPIEIYGDRNITINRSYMPNMAVDSTSYHGPTCFGVQASTVAPYAGNSIVENSSFSGAPNSYAEGISCVGNMENNTGSNLVFMLYPCGNGTMSGNRLNDCGYPSFPAGSSGPHGNAIQVNSTDSSPFYIYNNVASNTGYNTSEPDKCESMFIGPGQTYYVWHNVLYNINGDSLNLDEGSGRSSVSIYYWNNSIEADIAGSAYCLRAGHEGVTIQNLVFENNLCITSAAWGIQGVDTPGDGSSLAASSKSTDHNLRLRPAWLAARAISGKGAYACAGTAGSARTVRSGHILASEWRGGLRQLCDRSLPVSRPASGLGTWGLVATVRSQLLGWPSLGRPFRPR